MSVFNNLVRDWNEGSNAFKNMIIIASFIGVLGYHHAMAALLIPPAVIYVGIMNTTGHDRSRMKLPAFVVGVLFSAVLFGTGYGIGVGANALFGS